MAETPEEMSARFAAEALERFRNVDPAIQMTAGVAIALSAVLDLLIAKEVISAQEVLDVLARASDEVQASGGASAGVRMIELLCNSAVKAGATRRST